MLKLTIATTVAALVICTSVTSAAADWRRILGGAGQAQQYYGWGNDIYQYEMRRQGNANPPAIGSRQFFRNNFPPTSWDDYSRSTGGVFVRPQHCWGPYC